MALIPVEQLRSPVPGGPSGLARVTMWNQFQSAALWIVTYSMASPSSSSEDTGGSAPSARAVASPARASAAVETEEASSQLIETRRIGASRRMLSTPTPARTVVLGETLGRFAVALFQGLVIVVVTMVLFPVDWGDPLSTAAVVILFSLVGTGAAMLMGSVLNNEQQAGSLGVFFSLGLGALGGCMVPLEVFPPLMVKIAHVTPHAWAVDAFTELIARGRGLADILRELGVLALYGAVLLSLATRMFRRTITA